MVSDLPRQCPQLLQRVVLRHRQLARQLRQLPRRRGRIPGRTLRLERERGAHEVRHLLGYLGLAEALLGRLHLQRGHAGAKTADLKINDFFSFG